MNRIFHREDAQPCWARNLKSFTAKTRRARSCAKEYQFDFAQLRALRRLYVQEYQETFYYASSCSRDDERSEESCEHDDRPKTDRVRAIKGRREAWFKPIPCLAARTAD